MFSKKRVPRLKAGFKEHLVERDETNKTFLAVKLKSNNELVKKLQPYTGWGEPKPIQVRLHSS